MGARGRWCAALLVLLGACGDDSNRGRADAGSLPDADAGELPRCVVPDTHADLEAALLDPICSTVGLRPGTYDGIFTTSHDVVMSVVGDGEVVLDGGGEGSVLTIENDADVTLVGLIVQNGEAPDGGGIHNTTAGRLTLRDSIVRDSVATGEFASGGGILSVGPVFLDHAVVSGNQVRGAQVDGGGIRFQAALSLMNGSVVEANAAIGESAGDSANAGGGGIYSFDGTVTVTGGSAVRNNRAEATNLEQARAGAGGIFAGEIDLTGASRLSGNQSIATSDGAAFASAGGMQATAVLVSERSAVEENAARATGTAADAVGGGMIATQVIIDAGDVIGCSAVATATGTSGLASGGGLYVRTDESASIRIRESRLTDNRVSEDSPSPSSTGGAIWAVAEGAGELTVVIESSTIESNQADYGGGALYLTSFSSAVLLADLVNSTFHANSVSGAGSGGGAILAGASGGGDGTQVDLFNVTMVGNGAAEAEGGAIALARLGLDSTLVVTASSSIIHGNAAASGPNLSCSGGDTTAAFVSRGYNILDDTTGCTVTGDTGQDQNGVDPMLGVPADNGGLTPTLLPQAGSPAIEGGDPAGCLGPDDAPLTTDQRGLARPVGVCDVGAVEVQP